MKKIMILGYSNNIQVDDLYECLPEDKSGHVGPLLNKFVHRLLTTLIHDKYSN